MKSSLIILLILGYINVFGQFKTVYYDSEHHIVSERDSASTYRYITFDSLTNKYHYREFLVFLSLPIIEEGELLSIDPEIKDGEIIVRDIFGNSIVMNYKINEFIEVARSYEDKLLSETPIYPSTRVTKLPAVNHKVITDSNFRDSAGIYIRKSLKAELGSIEYLDKPYKIDYLIDMDGKISRIRVQRMNGKKLNRDVEQKIIYGIESFFYNLQYEPAEFENKIVRCSGTIVIRI